MKRQSVFLIRLHAALLITLGASVGALAKEKAHVHGLMQLNVAVDAKTLSVQLEAPLDSLLGFESRPRTPAQKEAASALLKKMSDATALIRPEAAASCQSTQVSVESEVLQPGPAGASGTGEHADLDARYEFTCERPDKLTFIEFEFFSAFKRVQKIEVQVAGGKGQSKKTLKRPDKRLTLKAG